MILPQFFILTPRVLNESTDIHTVPQFWKWYILWVWWMSSFTSWISEEFIVDARWLVLWRIARILHSINHLFHLYTTLLPAAISVLWDYWNERVNEVIEYQISHNDRAMLMRQDHIFHFCRSGQCHAWSLVSWALRIRETLWPRFRVHNTLWDLMILYECLGSVQVSSFTSRVR